MIKLVYIPGFLGLLLPILLQDETWEPKGLITFKWLTEFILAGFFLMIILLFYKAKNRVKKSDLKNQIQDEIDEFRKEITKTKTSIIEKPVSHYKAKDISCGNNRNTSKKKKSEEKEIEQTERLEEKNTLVNTSPPTTLSPITEDDQLAQTFDLKVNTEIANEFPVFLGAPDNEKVFYAPEATQIPNANTLFVIGHTMKLSLHNNINPLAMKSAMNSVEIHVKRVCEILNKKEPQHSKIVMLEPGEVAKENEDFLVINKMKVKFE